MMDCRFGHKFRPRYDEKRWGPQWLEDSSKEVTKLSGFPEKDYIKTYVQDVCVRCGLIAKRGEK